VPVALIDFECVYDGQVVRLEAGRDWVREGHEILERYPANFGTRAGRRSPSPRAPVRSRSARAATDDVELRASSRSPISIVLDDDARSTIVCEVLEWVSDYYEDGGYETGSYLYGRRSARGGSWIEEPTQELEITFAALAGAETERGLWGMRQDSAYGQSIARALREQRRPEHLIGDYHSHLGVDDGTPSPADLRGWMRCLQLLVRDDPTPKWLLGDEVPVDCFAGIIVTRSASGSWLYPDMHAWITRRAGDAFVCEPAILSGA
jgi:hypothetical protein